MKTESKSKRTNSFKLFWNALKGSGSDIWKSFQVLAVITIVFAVFFFCAEHRAQPDEYGSWRGLGQSVLWSFLQYIKDPGKFAQVAPVTFWGRLMGTCIGILGILIFAVPAGVIGARFKKAIEEDNRRRELDEYSIRLHKAFSRKQCRHTRYRTIPRYVPVATIQAQQRMDVKDIMDTIDANPDFRLRNLASTQNVTEHPQDRLVVEYFPITKGVSYGCKILRDSKITIVSTSSVSEAGIGSFAYYIALFGGFNFISKEFEVDQDDPTSYYVVQDSKIEEKNDKGKTPLKDFIEDLSQLACDDNHWLIFLLSASGAEEPIHPTQFHFIHRANEKVGVSTTTIQEKMMLATYDGIKEMLEKDFGLKSDLDEYYLPVGPKNIASRLEAGRKTNAFTLRVAFSVTTWDDRNIAIARKLADELSQSLVGKTIEEDENWKKKGNEY